MPRSKKLNVGLRKTRRELREAREASTSQRLRPAAAGYTGPELDKYVQYEDRVRELKAKYRMCKEAMRVGC